MSAKQPGPPKGKPWTWVTRELLSSEAWRSMAVNTRKLVDFLMLEHISQGGKENGKLMAPRHQLEAFGIGARHVSPAIEEAVSLGLVDVKRGIGRRASRYALNWLPLHDGTMPTPRWQPVMTSEGKSLLMTSEGIPQRYPKGSHKARSDFRREVANPVMTSLRTVSEGKYPSREDLTNSSDSTDLSGGQAQDRGRVNGQPDGGLDRGAGEGHGLDGEVAA